MKKDLKILRQDIEVAEKFCKAIDRCRLESAENCIFIPSGGNRYCLKCEVSIFKSEVTVKAQPFLEAWKKISALSAFSAKERRFAFSHVFLGLGALYSLNQKRVPVITDALVQEITEKGRENVAEAKFLNEIINDLKNLGYDWYENFYSVWSDSQLIDKIWMSNILLLKIFLEAIRLESSDPKKNKEPIPEWRSKEEKKQLADEVLDFLHEEAKKKNK